jgi:hypothetical protein
MLASTPEGRPLGEFLLGKRYICKLNNFPFTDLTEIDHETRSKLRRFRGVQVGELEGLGKGGTMCTSRTSSKTYVCLYLPHVTCSTRRLELVK